MLFIIAILYNIIIISYNYSYLIVASKNFACKHFVANLTMLSKSVAHNMIFML